MSPRTAVAVIAVATALIGALPAAEAPAQPAPPTQLRGSFQMNGRVTVAQNVRGETVGEVVQRTWTFTPQCPIGPCVVQLVRGRATGTDTLTLQQTATDTYAGSGTFFAPLRCAGRVYPHGQEVPFRITVHITAVTGDVASTISATYVNRSRINLTRCVGVLGHDAARYTGQLVPG